MKFLVHYIYITIKQNILANITFKAVSVTARQPLSLLSIKVCKLTGQFRLSRLEPLHTNNNR